MRPTRLIIALSLLLSGCTATQFERPETTPSQMEKDKYECEVTGRSAHASTSTQRDLYRRCMSQRGYAIKA